MISRLKRSPDLYAIIILIMSLMAFMLSDATTKVITEDLPLLQAVWLRSLLCSVMIASYLVITGHAVELKTNHLKTHIPRGLLFTAMICSYMLVLKHFPLNMMNAAYSSAPLLIVVLAAVVLKETISAAQWLSTAIGFTGVLMILQPDLSDVSLATLSLLFIPIAYAYILISAKQLAGQESAWTTNFYSFFPATLILTYWGLEQWQHISFNTWGVIVLSSLAAVVAFSLLIHAFQIGHASILAPFQFSAVLMALLIDILFWHLWPTTLTIIGSLLIMLCGLLQILAVKHKETAEK